MNAELSKALMDVIVPKLKEYGYDTEKVEAKIKGNSLTIIVPEKNHVGAGEIKRESVEIFPSHPYD